MNLPTTHRYAGVLAPIFTLRGSGDSGIGDTAALCEFIDWAAETGIKVINLLPINETGPEHSPYNAISSQAIEPTTLHLAPGWVPGLSEEDAEALASPGSEAGLELEMAVDYPKVSKRCRRLLEKAFQAWENDQTAEGEDLKVEFEEYCQTEHDWLEDYALFRTLMEVNASREKWRHWPAHHVTPGDARAWLNALEAGAREPLMARQRYHRYVQWVAARQWRKVKRRAESKGVALMGDIPFGISNDSADVWAAPHLFRQGWYGGAPPEEHFQHDAFIRKWGQNWGIPLYDWEAHRAEGFRWWRQRIAGVREYFDLFRIDHILGFFRVYGFPWSPDRNEEFTLLESGAASLLAGGSLPAFLPRADESEDDQALNLKEGRELLRHILVEVPPGSVIGEDLGEVPPYVRPCLRDLGIAGYKIPQWELEEDGALISGKNYERHSLATYGTHDHDPLRCWWEELNANAGNVADGGNGQADLKALVNFAGLQGKEGMGYNEGVQRKLFRALLESHAWLVIFSLVDVLGGTDRYNYPGTKAACNWCARMPCTIQDLREQSGCKMLGELVRECRTPHIAA